jgi:hypothetical protein
MNMRSLMSVTLIWVGMVAPVLGFQTAAVFPVSRVEHVDLRNHLLTFKTQDGNCGCCAWPIRWRCGVSG